MTGNVEGICQHHWPDQSSSSNNGWRGILVCYRLILLREALLQLSLASGSWSLCVWSVHPSEAHYSSAQRPEKTEPYPPQQWALLHLQPLLCHFVRSGWRSHPSLVHLVIISGSSDSSPTVHKSSAALIIDYCFDTPLKSAWYKSLTPPLPFRIINVFRRWTLYLPRQPVEITSTSPLSVFQVGHLLLWPSPCPAVTWLCLIPPRSSESRSLILPTLCPTSLHNLLSPNFSYRSHWLSFVCVWKAYSRLLARGCRQSTERTAAAPPHQSWSQGWFIIPGLGFVCQQLLIHLQGINCGESIDGEANAFKCKITPHLIMMLLIAPGTANCHLSRMLLHVCSVHGKAFSSPLFILSSFSLIFCLHKSVVLQGKRHQVRAIYFISTPDAFESTGCCQEVSQGNQWYPITVPQLKM